MAVLPVVPFPGVSSGRNFRDNDGATEEPVGGVPQDAVPRRTGLAHFDLTREAGFVPGELPGGFVVLPSLRHSRTATIGICPTTTC